MTDDKALHIAYDRLCGHEGLNGTNVSIDRARDGGETVNVTHDWIEGPTLAFVLSVARELELELVVSRDGLRLAEHDDEFSERVRGVKQRIAEDRDGGDDE